jgi:integrase
VVLRYRSYLEARLLAPGTINLRLGAVRRLVYEAADSGLLSSDLAAGIRRVKGVRNLGVRLGNWLTVEQSRALWQAPDSAKLKGKRDRALLALLLACGLRRHEAVSLRMEHLEQREEHWAIVDLKGKAGHVRTIPVPDWVMEELRAWLIAAGIDRGRIFRRVTKMGRILGEGLPPIHSAMNPIMLQRKMSESAMLKIAFPYLIASSPRIRKRTPRLKLAENPCFARGAVKCSHCSPSSTRPFGGVLLRVGLYQSR